MIDISSEAVVTLTEATKHLPARRKGKRPNVATLYRWAQVGVRGVRLETLQVGGTKCTSLEALQRFCERLTDPRTAASARTSKACSRAIAHADAESDTGIRNPAGRLQKETARKMRPRRAAF